MSETRIVTASGARIPAIGFGTWRASGDAARRACERALAVGYRHIDTAQLYGNEVQVGDAIRASGVPREDLFVTTKVWRDALEPGAAIASIEESLHRLGGADAYIDLLLIHWPHPTMDLRATLDAMQTFGERVRHIGVSNFPSALVHEAAAHAPIVCNQIEYHPYLSQTAVLAACRAHHITIAAYCPIARGAVVHDPVLQDIGTAHGRTAAQVTLRWLVQQPGVVALPKSTTPSRIEENLNVDFELSDEEMRRIYALAQPDGRLVDPFPVDWD